MKAKTQRKTHLVKRSISLPDQLLNRALVRARDEHRTFSNYVQVAIEKELTGAIAIEDKPKAA